MTWTIDTESLLTDIAAFISNDAGHFDRPREDVALSLIQTAALAIRQLQERIKSERRKLANAEERVNALLEAEVDDGR